MNIPDKDFDLNKFKDGSGKSRIKRMASVFTGKGRNTGVMRRIAAGALAVIVSVSTLSSLIDTTSAETDSETIISFERISPVYTEWVDNGTAKEDLNLPETLRAVVEIPETIEETVAEEPSLDMATIADDSESEMMSEGDSSQIEMVAETEASEPVFTQTAPTADEEGDYDYYWYGYVAPRDEEELRKAGELVIYTIYYADDTEAYRVYGKYDGMDEGFYACDEEGEITGIIKDVPVTWTGNYQADEADTYTFTAELADEYDYDDEMPIAEITVKEADEETGDEMDEETDSHDDCGEVYCSCGTTTDKHDKNCDLYVPECTCEKADEGHVRGCPLWNPDCTCPDGTEGHTDIDCPYYAPEADCDCQISSLSKPWEHLEGCKYFGPVECTCESGVHDPANKDCLKYVSMQSFSINGGGANDIATDTFMTNNTPTSGNGTINGLYAENIPGEWTDYINTIWMNKAYNKFAWAPSESTSAYNNWVWSGEIASETKDTVTDNPLRFPSKDASNVWMVYSGEQLSYALKEYASGDTIKLGGNLNLNGNSKTWKYHRSSKNITINGNGYTIYNLGIYTPNADGAAAFFVGSSGVTYIEVRDLSFKNAKIVHNGANKNQIGLFILVAHNQKTTAIYDNIMVSDSLVYNTYDIPENSSGSMTSVLGSLGNTNETSQSTTTVTKCIVDTVYVYGGDHVTMTFLGATAGTVSNCYVVNSLLCGKGGHSAVFPSCNSVKMQGVITDCFSSAEVYGTSRVSGFIGWPFNTITNCYATGKVEGYSYLAGFTWDDSDRARNISNCYSTALVGLRNGGTYLGGFITSTVNTTPTITDCYAAGEVGNYDTDMDNPQNIGGFSEQKRTYNLSNCYYDKQTTAMREWNAGNSKAVNGVTGVLTTKTAKAGLGLTADPTDPANASITTGFQGFSDNTEWVYQEKHYPQLEVFANASVTDWGSVERADAVKAWSRASTSTIFLDTWDDGYDWDDQGVRTSDVTSYDRALVDTGKTDHKGYQYTYDTVREIVSDFTVTNITANATNWTQLISGGAPAQLTDVNGITAPVANSITISGSEGKVNNPGLDWYTVSETVNGQTGYRPLRLIAYMNVEAGRSQSIAAGETYNHRDDVELTMMDTIIDNLVVGLNDAATWSTATVQDYPDSYLYYAVPTTSTNFSASHNAWIYTEISRAKKDTNGDFVDEDGVPTTDDTKLVPEYSVKVTGPGTGSNLTIDEQKWNGEYPLYPDTTVSHKYIITYYWMLEDGRYRTDSKVITITPGEYDVTVNVHNAADGSANSTALYPAAAADSGANTAYSFGTNTSAGAQESDSNAQALNNTYSTNVTAAWKKKVGNTKITKMVVTLTSGDKTTVMGDATITGNIKEGSQITIPIEYFYVTLEPVDEDKDEDDPTQSWREVTKTETVNVTYTVEIDASGGYYLRFNKLANIPENEALWVYEHGDYTGIPSDAQAYINDLTHNVQIDLYVVETGELTVNKVLTDSAEEEETFVFQVDYCGNGAEAGSVERTMYAVITIPAGQKTGMAKFIEMPPGWYTVTELDSNWRFELLDDELEVDNPGAAVDADNAKVTMYIEEHNEIDYTYQNKRLDVPWANGKHSVTNDMPALTGASGTSGAATPLPADTGSDSSHNTNAQGKAMTEATLPSNDEKYKVKASIQVKKV